MTCSVSVRRELTDLLLVSLVSFVLPQNPVDGALEVTIVVCSSRRLSPASSPVNVRWRMRGCDAVKGEGRSR